MKQSVPELTPQQAQRYCCKQILEFAKAFYQNPKNVQAYESWAAKKQEEEKHES